MHGAFVVDGLALAVGVNKEVEQRGKSGVQNWLSDLADVRILRSMS